MPLVGDTIKLSAEFAKFDGQAADPSELTLNVYDITRKQVDTKSALQSYRITTGVYEVPYTVPDGDGVLIYEFSGTVEGYPVVVRGVIERRWV